MAEGKPVGTMYVELSLDATKYTKAQQDILNGAEKNSADINKVFKTVGTQSDAMYDAMRKNIENALTAIKQSHLSTEDEIRRAKESAAAKIADIDKKQFGEQTSMLDKLKSNYIAATVAIAAAIGAVSGAWNLLRMGAEYAEQQGILNNLAKKYETTADDIVSSMRSASDGLISNVDLMKVALGGLAKGLDPEQLTNLADAARILGDVVGVNATTALNDLTQALESGRVKGLKSYLGTAIDLKESFGDLESSMTATEKANALYNLVMISSIELQSQQTGAVSDTADKMDRIEASYKNAKLAAGSFFEKAVAGAYDLATSYKFMTAADITEWFYKLAGGTVKATEAAVTNTEEVKKSIDPHLKQIETLKKLLETRKAAETLDKEEPKRLKEIEEARSKAIEEHLKATSKEVDDIREIFAKGTVAEYKRIEDVEKERERMIEVHLKAVQDEQDGITEAIKKGNDTVTKADEKFTTDRVKAERDMYKDIRGYTTENYEATISMIAEQKKKYEEMKISNVAISVWEKNEIEKAEIAKGKAGNDFFDGMKAGYLELKRSAETWGQAGYEIFKSFADNSSKTVSSVLFDGITGQMKSFQEYWKSFTDSLLRTLADIIAKMIVQWGLYQAAAAASSAFGFTMPGGVTNPFSAAVSAGTGAAVNAGIAAVGGGSATGATLAAGGSIGGISLSGGMVGATGTAGIGGGSVAGGSTSAGALGGVGGVGLVGGLAVGAIGAIGLDIITGGAISNLLGMGSGPSMGDLTPEQQRAVLNPTMAAQYYEEVHGGRYDPSDGYDRASLRTAQGFLDYYANFWGEPFDPDRGYKSGLDYVPRDNFRARLHEGEAVLTKEQASQWRGTGDGASSPVYFQILLDGKELSQSTVKEIRSGNPELIKYLRRAVA